MRSPAIAVATRNNLRLPQARIAFWPANPERLLGHDPMMPALRESQQSLSSASSSVFTATPTSCSVQSQIGRQRPAALRFASLR